MNRPFVHFIGNLEELKNKKYTEHPRKPSVQSTVESKTSKYKLLFYHDVTLDKYNNMRIQHTIA